MESQQLLAIGAAGVAIALVALATALASMRALRRLRADYAALISEGRERSPEQRFAELLARVDEQGDAGRRADQRLAAIEAALPISLCRVGLVQFQAFEDVGGGQSSALALLDASGSGVVMTALHARAGTRIYVKRVLDGRGDGVLGEEESQAIAAALAQAAYPSATR